MEGPREQCHFLFIEDNSDEAILLEHALSELAEPHGYRVCRNIGEAIAYLSGAGIYGDRARYPLPTVVVSDLMLGSESGLELIDWCRKHDEFKNFPVVVFTGVAGPSDFEMLLRRGATEVIQKPVQFDGLIDVLRDLAKRYCR